MAQINDRFNMVDVRDPVEYQKHFHTDKDGMVWLDGKGHPIPLNVPMGTEIDKISPTNLWNKRVTRGGHPV